MRPQPQQRAVLLFALPAGQEARAKHLSRAESLFAYSRRRIESAVAGLPGVDLLTPPQRGGSFAERLANALADARAAGYEEIVVVPGDVPQLGARELATAFALLAEHAVVLGPSPDGGIYLLGLAGDGEALLRGVHWRGATVFADLCARAGAPGVLDALADLDRPADLVHLQQLARRRGLEPVLDALLAGLRAAPFSPGECPAAPRLPIASRPLTRGPPAPPLPH